MKVSVVIEEDDNDEGVTMGVTSDGLARQDIFRLLIAGAEMVVYDGVVTDLVVNGATVAEAEYGAPMRTRLLAIEQLVQLELTPFASVHLDLPMVGE